MYDDYDIGQLQMTSSGLDGYWEEKDRQAVPDPRLARRERELGRKRDKAAARRRKNAARRKVSSIDDLDGFVRLANSNTLVRMSEQDLWTLKDDGDGGMVIERLIDNNGEPLKV